MTGYVGPIEHLTVENEYFRQVLFTGEHLQLVVMCLQPGEEIGNEVHGDVDQFFRIEAGEATFVINNEERYVTHDGDAFVVPAGAWHNVINTGAGEKLKLYTVYTPPEHPAGTVHKTKAEADAAEHHH